MIRHMVLTKFKPETDETTIRHIFDGLCALVATLPGASGFVAGPSESPEQMERGYTHAFVIDFECWAALETYAVHPDHLALGAILVDNTVGGIDGLLVLDLDVRV
ncbi:hypothetical protein GCM10011316_35440 [Roseibium aquae]|uniref:Stress-response A/B barrel domain-containing protein n=1 Tax=Roseibium aquae TaxID=1323746 RepID=A0A916TMM6_9HYPH|nr:Dabb family protein [Roseibium aquae]GGB60303.1 hypothetical protein GCM10011316_35440 [Roseibium aquae]